MRTPDMSWRGNPRELPPLALGGVVVPAILNVRSDVVVDAIVVVLCPPPPFSTCAIGLGNYTVMQSRVRYRRARMKGT